MLFCFHQGQHIRFQPESVLRNLKKREIKFVTEDFAVNFD